LEKELSSGTVERKRHQKQSKCLERPTKRRKYAHVTNHRSSNEIDELSSESEDSQDSLKKQLTGLPKKKDRSDNSHSEATARDYVSFP